MFFVLQRYFSPLQGPILTSKKTILPHSPKEKTDPARASVHLPLPFQLTDFCVVKCLFCFFPPPNPNTKTPDKPSAQKFLWMNCPKGQRHSPGTIPALKGSLHLPLYKDDKQNLVILVFSTGATKKKKKRQEASNYRSLIVLIRFLLNTQGSLQKFP